MGSGSQRRSLYTKLISFISVSINCFSLIFHWTTKILVDWLVSAGTWNISPSTLLYCRRDAHVRGQACNEQQQRHRTQFRVQGTGPRDEMNDIFRDCLSNKYLEPHMRSGRLIFLSSSVSQWGLSVLHQSRYCYECYQFSILPRRFRYRPLLLHRNACVPFFDRSIPKCVLCVCALVAYR